MAMVKKITLFLMLFALLVCPMILASCDEEQETDVRYTLKFDSDGGSKVSNQSVISGQKADPVNDPIKDGYTFEGWYYGEEKWSFVAYTVTQNMTLKAKWAPNTYKIIYVDELDVIEDKEQSFTIESEDITLPVLEKEGYVFDGWYNGSIKFDKITKGTYQDVTLTAKWHLTEYKITYSDKFYNSTTNQETYTINNTVLISDHFKLGYEFNGWYDLKGNKVTEIKKGTTGDITLVADWTPIKYTIEYLDTNGAANSNPLTYTVEDEFELVNLASGAEKTFLGWYDSQGNKFTKILKGTIGSISLTAHWKTAEVTPPTETYIYSKDTVLNKWSGQTLNVLVTPYYGTTASAPWSQMELNPTSFGQNINQAYEDRQAFILSTYGVTVNWIQSQSAQSIMYDLQAAATSSTTTFEIAMPRAHEVQSLVSLVYDMSESEYLDFSQSYFSVAAYEAFTVSGHTLFAGGDFTFADDLTAYMIFSNNDMVEELGVPNLYDAVKTGKWTYDVLLSLSRLVKGDNGNGTPDDEDIYGFATKSLQTFYLHSGIFEADVDKDTGLYRIALNLDEDKVDKVISNIIECQQSTDWCRVDWGGQWGSNAITAFGEGRVLFYHDALHRFADFGSVDFSVGVLPFPKLNSDQTRYYTPTELAITTFACIPKCTKDREMSEYFLDVLSWTGEDYIMKAWMENNQAVMDPITREDDTQILQEYVLDNMVFDVGQLTAGWDGLLTAVKKDAYKNGTNNFTQVFLEAQEDALISVNRWNENWASYSDD